MTVLLNDTTCKNNVHSITTSWALHHHMTWLWYYSVIQQSPITAWLDYVTAQSFNTVTHHRLTWLWCSSIIHHSHPMPHDSPVDHRPANHCHCPWSLACAVWSWSLLCCFPLSSLSWHLRQPPLPPAWNSMTPLCPVRLPGPLQRSASVLHLPARRSSRTVANGCLQVHFTKFQGNCDTFCKIASLVCDGASCL